MSNPDESTERISGRIFTKEVISDGKAAQLRCIEIGGHVFTASRGAITIARLEEEWFEDVGDPNSVTATLRQSTDFRPDLFTFWQRLPNTAPKYNFHMEWDNVAALRIKDYEYWWKHQLQSNARGHVRRAEKNGVITRESEFTDDFVRGMVEIFNETPVRQGRPFWHYGKDFAAVKREFSRYLFREQLIGAYHDDELIGFVMLAHADGYAVLGQIISKIRHRDKSPNNALLAKAVEICASRSIPFLVYAHWPSGTLADFKRQNGFEKIDVPRYYVPLTLKGAIALKCGAHRGWRQALPESVKAPLKRLRKMWYDVRAR